MKNNRGAMVIPIIIGIAMLVTTVIIALVVVQNIADVEDDTASYLTAYVYNEVTTANNTAKTLAAASKNGFRSPVAIAAGNTSSGLAINVANISITSAGVITNSSVTGYVQWDFVKLNYSYEYRATSDSVGDLRNNLTSGVNQVSSKIPTVLLVVAVVLIMGILVLLWQQFKKMDAGGGGSI